MSGLALKEYDVGSPMSSEAQRRINDTRVRELAFFIRQKFDDGSTSRGDIELIASIVVDGFDANARMDREYVKRRLIDLGRTPHKAEILADLLFK